MPYKDPEKAKQNKHQYYIKNKDLISIKNKEYRARPEIKERNKIYNLENKAMLYESTKKWRRNNPQYFIKQKEWRQKNNEKITQDRFNNRHYNHTYGKSYDRRRKIMVIDYYSKGTMQCRNCGIDVIELLTINHKYGGGAKHQKKIGLGHLYRWLVNTNFPSGFDVLCYNCNCVEPRVSPERYQEILKIIRERTPYVIKIPSPPKRL